MAGVLQGEFPVTVRVRVTEPAVTSSEDGVYVGDNVFALTRLPVPEHVQIYDE